MASNIVDLKTKLVCLNCTKPFRIPKLLPCGDSICESCLDELLKINKKSIKCPFCHNSHKVPKNGGFPKQNLIHDLMQSQIGDNLNENLREILEKFESNLLDLNSSVQEAPQKVQRQCDYIKDEIDISIESVIIELNQLKEQLVSQIDAYQEKCVQQIENRDSNERKKYQEVAEKCQNMLNEWKTRVASGALATDEVFTITKEASSLINELKLRRNEFEKSFYNDQVLLFKERTQELDTSILGKLLYRNYVVNDEKFVVDIDRLQGLESSSKITYADSIGNMAQLQTGVHKAIIQPIVDNHFFQCSYEVRTVSFTVALRVIDGNGTLIKHNFENTNSHLISACAFERLACVILRDNFGVHHLKLYDAITLRLVKETKLGYLPIACAMSATDIYVLSFQEPFYMIYNTDLESLPTRLHNDDGAIYMPMMCSMFIRNEKLFIKCDHDSRLRMYSLETGHLERSIDTIAQLSDTILDVDFSFKICCVNVNEKKLKIYDIFYNTATAAAAPPPAGVEIVYERNLSNQQQVKNGASLCVTDNGFIAINDPFTRSIFIY